MVHHAARMRQESTVCFPAPGLTRHLWAGLPLASARGRGADAGSFHPARGETCATAPRTFTVCLFCYYAPGLSYPRPRQVTMVYHAARMRLRRPACHGVATLSRRRMELSAPRQPDASGWFTPCDSKGRDTGREAAGQRAPSTETPPVTRRERSKRNCISEL